MSERQYLCIDQKSFYATVECVARGLDPMTTNLVVADPDRSRNTICYLSLKMSSRYHNFALLWMGWYIIIKTQAVRKT